MTFALTVVRLIITVVVFATVVRRQIIINIPRARKPMRVVVHTSTAEEEEVLLPVVPDVGILDSRDTTIDHPPPSTRRRLLFVAPEEEAYEGDHDSVMNEARNWQDEYYNGHEDGSDGDVPSNSNYNFDELSRRERMLQLVEGQVENDNDDEDDYGYVHVVERFTEFIDMDEDEEADDDDYYSYDGDDNGYNNNNNNINNDYVDAPESEDEAFFDDDYYYEEEKWMDDFNSTHVFEMYRKLGKEHEKEISEAGSDDTDYYFGTHNNKEVSEINNSIREAERCDAEEHHDTLFGGFVGH